MSAPDTGAARGPQDLHMGAVPVWSGEHDGEMTMGWLVWGGTGLALIGLLLLGYCIAAALQAKRAGLDDADMRARLQRIVTINMGALFLSVIGLMCVILGVFLG